MGSDNSSGVECGTQKSRFQRLTLTNRNAWVTADVENSIGADGKSYIFTNEDTKNFEKIQPFHSYLEQNDPIRLEIILEEHERNRTENKGGNQHPHYSCQFCGHGIIAIHNIKNEKTKQWLVIGSECIHGFENVDPVNTLMKKRDEKALRDAMRKFKPDVINKIWNDKKFAPGNRKTKTGRQKPKQVYINFWIRLKKLNVDTCSIKELKEIFAYAGDKLSFIEYPEFVEDIVHPRLAITKAKSKTGLDAFFDW